MDYSSIRIETKRLVLLSARREYAKNIFQEYRPPITLYMNHPSPKSIEAIEEGMIRREKKMKEGLILYLIVLRKETHEFMGSFALEDLEASNPEMGGWLKANTHGQGFGKEIVTAIKNWADTHLDYQAIIWPCAKENIASCKLAESLNGKIKKRYRKTTRAGHSRDYLEYHFSKNGLKQVQNT